MDQTGNSDQQHGHSTPHERGTHHGVDEQGLPILYEVVAPERPSEQPAEDDPDTGLSGATPQQIETLLRERVETALDDALHHSVGQALQAAEQRLREDLRNEMQRILPTLISEVLHKRSGH